MREEGVLLDDHPDAPPVRGQRGDIAVTEEHPPGGGPYEPGDRPQRGGLAGSGRPEQRHDLAGSDGEVEGVEDDMAVVGDGDAVEADTAAHASTPGNSATEPSTWVAPAAPSASASCAPVSTPATTAAPERIPLSMS